MEEKKSGSKAVILIVIAVIVAVLSLICLCGAVALAIFYPASVRYNEKARENSDLSAINEVYVAGEVVLNDVTYASVAAESDRYEVRIDRYGNIGAYDSSGAEVLWLQKEVAQIAGKEQLTFKSRKYQALTTDLVFTYEKTENGNFVKRSSDLYQFYAF